MGIVTLVFIYVIVQSVKSADAAHVQKKSNAIRRWWFLALVGLGIGVAYGTLKPFPISNQHTQSQTAQIVNVVGHQWYWELSRTQVEAGVPVEFDVTSADVNHGFAIYGPDDRIVTQTQAMPGYTNRLVYTFTESGKYRVRCLEYCGLVHHLMETEFQVVAAPKGGSS
ncbi:MAG: cytochrome oxidase [Stenotrophobium sp.]